MAEHDVARCAEHAAGLSLACDIEAAGKQDELRSHAGGKSCMRNTADLAWRLIAICLSIWPPKFLVPAPWF